MKKLSNNEAELKKSVAYKKVCILIAGELHLQCLKQMVLLPVPWQYLLVIFYRTIELTWWRADRVQHRVDIWWQFWFYYSHNYLYLSLCSLRCILTRFAKLDVVLCFILTTSLPCSCFKDTVELLRGKFCITSWYFFGTLIFIRIS